MSKALPKYLGYGELDQEGRVGVLSKEIKRKKYCSWKSKFERKKIKQISWKKLFFEIKNNCFIAKIY